jgi:hypothetical protein
MISRPSQLRQGRVVFLAMVRQFENEKQIRKLVYGFKIAIIGPEIDFC